MLSVSRGGVVVLNFVIHAGGTWFDSFFAAISRAGDYNKFSFNTSTGKYAREYCARLADVIHAQQQS